MKTNTRILAVGGASLALLIALGVGLAVAQTSDSGEASSFEKGFAKMTGAGDGTPGFMENMGNAMGSHRAQHGGMGLMEENGTFSSKAVSFRADPEAGSIMDLVYTDSDGNATPLAVNVTIATAAGNATTGELRGRHYIISAGDDAKLNVGAMPRYHVMAKEPTTVTIELPEGATVTLHEAVADWSPAGATIDYGTEKGNIRLADGTTLSVENQTLTVDLVGGGSLMFHLVRDHDMGPGMGHDGMHGGGMRDGDGMGHKDKPHGGGMGQG